MFPPIIEYTPLDTVGSIPLQSSFFKVYLNIRSHEPHEEVPVGSGIVDHGRVDKCRLGVENATHVFWHQVGDSFENTAIRGECRSDFTNTIAFQSENNGSLLLFGCFVGSFVVD